MADAVGVQERGKGSLVYRISTPEEWEELRSKGSTLGDDLDRSTGCFHLCDLHQVKSVLENFFKGKEDLYLLQVNKHKLGEGLIYEAVDESNSFPHFYGPSRNFVPLPLDAVLRAEKLEIINEYCREIENMDDHFSVAHIPKVHSQSNPLDFDSRWLKSVSTEPLKDGIKLFGRTLSSDQGLNDSF